MPSPVSPNDIKELIPSPTGSVCEKFAASITLPKKIYDLVLYMFNEDGSIAEDFAADICALECMAGESSGSGTEFGKPTGVNASDGTFSDKIRVTWSAVATATSYDVYRGTTNDSGASVLIGNTNNTTYDDESASGSTLYYYWVRAKNATQTSSYSTPDTGYQSAVIDVSAINLRATKGFSRGSNAFIGVVFERPGSANRFDIYINDSNDFATATLLDSDREPYDIKDSLLSAPPGSPDAIFVDNQTDLLYLYRPSSNADWFGKKYFWIVAKQVTGGMTVAISEESSSAEGWAVGLGDGGIPLSDAVLSSGDPAEDTPAGATKAWVALYGAGAGGAGGDGGVGGGGGGGGSMVVGWIDVVNGSKIRISSTPETDTGRAAYQTNGDDGAETIAEYSADGTFTDTVEIMNAGIPTGGVYAGGAGGTGAVGTADASVNDSVVFDGNDGTEAEADGDGGMGGHRFGGFRARRANMNGFTVGSYEGDGGTFGAGGGGTKNVSSPASSEGGQGRRGYAVIIYI